MREGLARSSWAPALIAGQWVSPAPRPNGPFPAGSAPFARLRVDHGLVLGEDFASVLACAQRGDEAAFARLWRDLNPALLRYLSLGGDPAEDVASDTWATVVK